ncbi:MAG: hypothetical protein JO140_02030 [Candidatus Eremiobacteraeota bacterium]|nr:hypothetical protein [Candidatus Eremiobacteraeota bacterium]
MKLWGGGVVSTAVEERDGVVYEHRQFGTFIVAIAVAIDAVLAAILASSPVVRTETVVLGPAFVLVGIAAGLFSSLTIRVTRTQLQWWLGIKPLGMRVALAEIASAAPIKTNVFEGWGIHLTWHGWLWNVAGFNAVQIELRGGTRYALGTPEPEKLTQAIISARV